LFDALGHPAIGYRTSDVHDPVGELERKLEAGTSRLNYDRNTAGYLRSLLDALHIPVESQMVVFSKTSLQSPLISATNPRAIYFIDDVAVAWPRGGFIEIAAQDPQQGVQFYMLQQQETESPRLLRAEGIRPGGCVNCHQAYATLGVPGMLARSVAAANDGRLLPYVANFNTDDRSPLEERWAGWFVTGSTGTARHLGNPDAVTGTAAEPTVVAHTTTIESLGDRPALNGYLAPYSDVAALLVLDHQARLVNLLTRTAWEVRVTEADRGDVPKVAREAAIRLVDALLFVDEAPLTGTIASSSGFAAVVHGEGAGGLQRSIAASARSRDAADAISLQLHDLCARFRSAADGGEERRLSTSVERAVGSRVRSQVLETLRRRSARHPRDPPRNQGRPSVLFLVKERASAGHHNVYVVYLRNPKGDGRAGYYVGMTGPVAGGALRESQTRDQVRVSRAALRRAPRTEAVRASESDALRARSSNGTRVGREAQGRRLSGFWRTLTRR
jgi:hypothetical protein